MQQHWTASKAHHFMSHHCVLFFLHTLSVLTLEASNDLFENFRQFCVWMYSWLLYQRATKSCTTPIIWYLLSFHFPLFILTECQNSSKLIGVLFRSPLAQDVKTSSQLMINSLVHSPHGQSQGVTKPAPEERWEWPGSFWFFPVILQTSMKQIVHFQTETLVCLGPLEISLLSFVISDLEILNFL